VKKWTGTTACGQPNGDNRMSLIRCEDADGSSGEWFTQRHKGAKLWCLLLTMNLAGAWFQTNFHRTATVRRCRSSGQVRSKTTVNGSQFSVLSLPHGSRGSRKDAKTPSGFGCSAFGLRFFLSSPESRVLSLPAFATSLFNWFAVLGLPHGSRGSRKDAKAQRQIRA
jgi:hypothetical protein